MTKRFTPKASDYTAKLADVQARALTLRKELAVLDAEERALKAFLMPFYDQGACEVERADGNLMVNYSVVERVYLDQEKARALLAKLGKKAPEFPVDVVTFRVKPVK